MTKIAFDEAVRIAAVRRGLANLLPGYTDRANTMLDTLHSLDQQVADLAKQAGVSTGDIYDLVPLSRKPTFKELANEVPLYAVMAVSPAGCCHYYTGKAGAAGR